MNNINRNYSKGQIIVLFAISLIVLVGIVGLAIDSGRAYGVKAKLSASVDAAAIAAARGLAVGANDSDRINNAKAAALKFYNGNFPDNYLGATRLAPIRPDPVHKSDGYWQVDVSGSATMPTTFMRVLNWNQITVAASGTAIRRDLDMILVLDVSGSLSSVFPTVKSAAINFIDKFVPSTDRIGLVAFSSGAQLLVPIDKTISRGFNKTTITNSINGLVNGGGTTSAEGMRVALNEINAVPALYRSSLRVIVFFSDGAPNGLPATFQYNTSKTPIPTVTGDLYSETDATGSAVGCGNSIPCGITSNTVTNGAWNTYLSSNTPANPISAFLPNNSGTTITITNLSPSSIPLVPNLVQVGQPGQRSLGASPYANTRCNVNKAARNMVELVANSARSWVDTNTNTNQPIAIYTLGLGSALNTLEITFCGYSNNEKGANIMKRLANTNDSDTLQSSAVPPGTSPQPNGLYCYADITADPYALDSCFTAIASDMLRLSR